jgi:four helix bundle protein
LVELHNQIIISKDIDYLNESDYKTVEEKIIKVGRILTGLIRSTNNL